MKYIEWNIDPVVFRVADIPVMYYSLLLIAGTVLSVWILKRVYKENGMPWEQLQILVMLSIAGLFLGARLGHCLVYEYEYYFAHPLEILFPIRVKTDGTVIFSGYQGMASHGGLVGWIIAMVIYSWITGEKVLRTLDTIALVLPLAAGFIRLGNLANSEMIGIETDVPWAFVFERVDLVPRHPAQVYEALAYFWGEFASISTDWVGALPGSAFGEYPRPCFRRPIPNRIYQGTTSSFRRSDELGCGTGAEYSVYFTGNIFAATWDERWEEYDSTIQVTCEEKGLFLINRCLAGVST